MPIITDRSRYKRAHPRVTSSQRPREPIYPRASCVPISIAFVCMHTTCNRCVAAVHTRTRERLYSLLLNGHSGHRHQVVQRRRALHSRGKLKPIAGCRWPRGRARLLRRLRSRGNELAVWISRAKRRDAGIFATVIGKCRQRARWYYQSRAAARLLDWFMGRFEGRIEFEIWICMHGCFADVLYVS